MCHSAQITQCRNHEAGQQHFQGSLAALQTAFPDDRKDRIGLNRHGSRSGTGLLDPENIQMSREAEHPPPVSMATANILRRAPRGIFDSKIPRVPMRIPMPNTGTAKTTCHTDAKEKERASTFRGRKFAMIGMMPSRSRQKAARAIPLPTEGDDTATNTSSRLP